MQSAAALFHKFVVRWSAVGRQGANDRASITPRRCSLTKSSSAIRRNGSTIKFPGAVGDGRGPGSALHRQMLLCSGSMNMLVEFRCAFRT
jgi:hypothetical protein